MKKNISKLFAKQKAVLVSIALTLLLAISTVFLGACKSDDSSQSSTPTPPPPAPTTYVVSFETNGGSAVAAVEVSENATLDLNDYTTTKENSYFYGWCLDEQLTVRASSVITVTSNVKLYAEWGVEELYWLHFETGAGSDIASVQYKPNAYLAIPEEPTRTNYAFGGWYKDEACTREFTFFGAQMPRQDLTVYAKWTTLSGIIFETNGGSQVPSVFGATGEPIGAIVEPTKENYIFEGWYADEELTIPYDCVTIPKNVITVYAKWHEQMKNIQITLHLNHAAVTATSATATGAEGEMLDASATVATFRAAITEAIKTQYLGDAADLTSKPIYNFSAWAYDAKGSNRFDGVLPHAQQLDLYAVWTRSASYCQVSFAGETESYFVKKNTAVPNTVVEPIINGVKAEYEAKGCTVDGFYTVGGNRYQANDLVAMDMLLYPYVYSANLVYEYVSMPNDKGKMVNGYVLKGYANSVAEEYKAKDGLLLLVPEYYNDGTHGQYPVIWVGDNAFADYPVNEVTLPNGIFGLGTQAFKNTKLTSVSLPSSLYYLGDNTFSGSTALATITFNSELTHIGATVFDNTAYETTMPTTSGFVFFDTAKTVIYGYTGTATTVSTPGTAVTIVGGAFKNNTVVKELTLHDNLRYVSDYAFEGSALQTVKIGKAFANMGKGIFKNCHSLTTVTFVSAYNLSYIGESMFEGCTALKNINVSALQNLQAVNKNAFYGCTSLPNVTFANSLGTLGESAFENCTSLAFANFGTSDYASLTTISNQAFKNCTSLRRIVLRGALINNQTVKFGTNVLTGAGYTKNSSFVTPVIYVKDTWVDNWSVDDDFKTASYVQIYQKVFANTEYKNIVIKAIDSTVPTLTVHGTVQLTTNTANISAFDLMAFLKTEGVYTVSDDTSEAADCLVYIQSVVKATNGTAVANVNGKYDLSAAGTYQVLLVAEDECGNIAEAQVIVVVTANV